MRVIYGINAITLIKKPVVALGVFDGVHRAHRKILVSAIRQARAIGGTSTVVTFWPHPQREGSLYSLDHRLRLLGELGIQITIVINFTKAFAETSHEEFIENILVNRLRARYVFIGKNFRFGKGARGDCRFLRKMSHRYNFRLKVFEVMQLKGKPVSSTNIRRLITKGDLSGARKLLLRPVTILGTVIRGVTLGRRLGFPTANVNPHHEVLPPSGIYIVKIFLDNKPLVLPVLSPRRKHGEGFRSSKHTTHQGVCYIGTKPTIKERLSSGIKKSHEKFIEVHIFNFMKNIYGRDIEVQFIKKMRDDRKFESLPALIEQIKKDITYAKKYFSRH